VSIDLREMGVEASAILAAMHDTSFPPGEIWGEDAIRSLFDVPGTRVFVACKEDLPLGFIMWRGVLDEAEILTIAVVPEARCRGIGGRLVDALRLTAGGEGVSRLFLEVAVENRAARHMYDRAGFVMCGMRKGYYGPGRDALVLVTDPAISRV